MQDKTHYTSPALNKKTLCGRNREDFNFNEKVSDSVPTTCKRCLLKKKKSHTITRYLLDFGENLIQLPNNAIFLHVDVDAWSNGNTNIFVTALVDNKEPEREYTLYLYTHDDYFDGTNLKYIGSANSTCNHRHSYYNVFLKG